MLILGRKPEEDIVISGPCVIRVVALTGRRVRLGILADRSTSVVRGELLSAPGNPLRSIWERLTGSWRSEPIEVVAPAETPAA